MDKLDPVQRPRTGCFKIVHPLRQVETTPRQLGCCFAQRDAIESVIWPLAAECCKLMQHIWRGMAQKKRAGGRQARKEPSSIRASVSLRPETYRTLEALARQKKVSTAWVLRDAAEKYVAEQWPLLAAVGPVREGPGQ